MAGYIKATAKPPEEFLTPTKDEKEKGVDAEPNPEYENWVAKDQQVVSFLLSFLGKEIFTQVSTTTRNGIFAECKLLCRMSKIGNSAKNSTRQKRALGKGLLCLVPYSRQKRGTRHRLPRVTVFGHVLLYQVRAVRHSANKVLFFKKILCRVSQIWHSAKI